MNIIERAVISDAPELLSLQKLAFISVAELEGYEILPLTQTVEDVEEAFDQHVILKYVVDGKMLGSVRAHQEGDTCHISRLMVHPNSENMGIGKALMHEIEGLFPDTRMELFTATINKKNISFYQKLGYRGYKEAKLPGVETLFIFMEK
ncbi:Acetyltransferase (GNAT) domain-containing protein [Mesobacillus persicus]|uniref:Acetyltransferase (GNAT) domain-containing protein n=1 Tax=Mesobacillus persicus TaxID=930146 RepID=A0A1H8G483_9BACI|nr:GNAT family N-acetyltransferase [Mesobacillus persicus]SEN38806.1 Acetyltransferase (GNAT) domain-containing protein [Mesobacillus persicus]